MHARRLLSVFESRSAHTFHDQTVIVKLKILDVYYCRSYAYSAPNRKCASWAKARAGSESGSPGARLCRGSHRTHRARPLPAFWRWSLPRARTGRCPLRTSTRRPPTHSTAWRGHHAKTDGAGKLAVARSSVSFDAPRLEPDGLRVVTRHVPRETSLRAADGWAFAPCVRTVPARGGKTRRSLTGQSRR